MAMRWRALIRRQAVSEEIAEELRYHLDREVERYLGAGMNQRDAERAARRAFGNPTAHQEAARDAVGWSWLEQLGQDMRYAARSLRRSRAFTIASVLSLALAIGAATAVMSAIDALLLRRLSVRAPQELFGTHGGSYPFFQRARALDAIFTDVAATAIVDRTNVSVRGAVDSRLRPVVRVALVSGNYFSLLGVPAHIGRVLTRDDDRTPGGHPVAVVSEEFASGEISRASVLGGSIQINETMYTIVGVAARGFNGEAIGRPVDVWVPMMMQSEVMPEMPGLLAQNNGWLRLITRARADVPLAQAQASLDDVLRQTEIEHLGADRSPQMLREAARSHLELVSIEHGYTRNRDALARALTVLLAVVALVLVIAFANVANLLLARAVARQREMAIRVAVGAGRLRLARQLVTESLLLSILGTAVGLLASLWGGSALSTTLAFGPTAMDSRNQSPWLSLDLHPDARVFGLAVLLCLATAALFGLVSALRGSSASVADSLGTRGAIGASPKRFGLGRSLVVTQVAFSLVLVVASGLLARTLYNLRSSPTGLDRDHLLLVWTAPAQTGRSAAENLSLVDRAIERLRVVPGVVSVGATNKGPLEGGDDSGGPSEALIVEGVDARPGLGLMRAAATPSLFAATGMRIVAGRALIPNDDERTPHVAVINERMARFYFGSANPIGRHFNTPGDRIEIVGVVSDVKHGSPRDRRGIWYVPARQLPGLMRNACFIVRTATPPRQLASNVQRALREVDSSLPILRVDTIDEQLDDVLVQERLITALVGGLGALALVLAMVGLFGLIAYMVSRRTNEIGIRIALGARRADVVRMILGATFRLVIIGVVIGVPLAVAATNLIAQRLYGLSPFDPLTIAGAVVVMLVTSVAAGIGPAGRAARVDPLEALRRE